MQSAVCVSNEAPVLNSLVICVSGPFATPSGNSKKRGRSNSLVDMNNRSLPKKRIELSGERPETSLLTTTIWTTLQSKIISTKNLRNITQVMLAFFKEQELAQMRLSGLHQPVYPVVVPVVEVYSMLAPRKRRVYDVLHVLEGVGVLKRTHDKNKTLSRFRGGQFLYFGGAGARKRLEAIYQRTHAISRNAAAIFPNRQNIDAMLMAACNSQAAIEGWPYLAATTVSFLSFVLESDWSTTISLGLLSRRLVDARMACEGTSREERDDLITELTRRMYDVVSVLESLNIVILTSLSDELKNGSGRRAGRASPRKGIVFNAAVFSDASLIRVGMCCSSQLEAFLAGEKLKIAGTTPQKGSERAIQDAEDNVKDNISSFPCFPAEFEVSSVEDLFPTIEPSDCIDNLTEWWDVPLRDLLLRDALPRVEFLDWEIMQAISRSRRSVGGSAPSLIGMENDSSVVDDVDLECHEELEEVV